MVDETHEQPADEALLHQWLDGELPSEGMAALERRFAQDPALAERAAALRGMETWLRDTRPIVPADLVSGVMEAIGQQGSARETFRPRRWLARLAPPRAWVWAPLAAAAALVLFLAQRDVRPPRPGDGHVAGPSPLEVADAESSRTAPESDIDSVRCVFQFAARDAHQVCLVGSFNLWKVCDTPLQPTRDGKWAVTVELPRGRYEYVFVVDGQWVADPAARLKVDDEFGGQKAILLL